MIVVERDVYIELIYHTRVGQCLALYSYTAVCLTPQRNDFSSFSERQVSTESGALYWFYILDGTGNSERDVPTFSISLVAYTLVHLGQFNVDLVIFQLDLTLYLIADEAKEHDTYKLMKNCDESSSIESGRRYNNFIVCQRCKFYTRKAISKTGVIHQSFKPTGLIARRREM